MGIAIGFLAIMALLWTYTRRFKTFALFAVITQLLFETFIYATITEISEDYPLLILGIGCATLLAAALTFALLMLSFRRFFKGQ
jgi:hypothetical protein